jgi:signal transduction histidine kinase
MAAILILCSNEDACNALGNKLQSLMNCNVLTAENAGADLDGLHGKSPYTVILDARLQDLNGLDVDETAQNGCTQSHLTPQAAHGLRSPLNSIIGMAQLIQKSFFGELNEKQIELAKVIVRSGYQLLDAIDKLEMNGE